MNALNPLGISVKFHVTRQLPDINPSHASDLDLETEIKMILNPRTTILINPGHHQDPLPHLIKKVKMFHMPKSLRKLITNRALRWTILFIIRLAHQIKENKGRTL